MNHQAVDLAANMQQQCLGIRAERFHRIISRAYDRRLRDHGVSLAQLEILAVLTMRGSCRQSDLARALAVDRSTIKRNLDLLAATDLVSWRTNESGRAVGVVVSESGQVVLASCREAWDAAQADLIDQLGPDARDVLDKWLVSLNGNNLPQ